LTEKNLDSSIQEGVEIDIKYDGYLRRQKNNIEQINRQSCKSLPQEINYEKMPKDKDWPIGDQWDEYYFFGGEDYELVFSLPKKWAKNLSNLDKGINEIGFFADGESSVEFKDNKKNKLFDNKPFKHF